MEPFSIEEYKQTYLSEARLNELYRNKLFKMFVPEKYGGLQLSLTDGLLKLHEVSRIQGGLGWSLNLGAGANWFSGFFNDEAANEIFLPEQAVIAGSGFTSGLYQKEKDDYSIQGSWSRCTGAKHATYFSFNATNNKDGVVKTFVIPRSQVELADEKWAIFGLRNTSSYAINIKNETVPKRYCFSINDIQNEEAYLVHRVPFETFARLCMSASFIGIVQCFVDRCKEYPVNTDSMRFIENELDSTIVSTSKNCMSWSERITRAVKENGLSAEINSDMKSSLGSSNVLLYNKVQELFLKGGLPLVEEDKLVHWAYRDILTAVQHYMVKP